ncbi:YgzB family protein [Salinicoccus sp. RF5]|uniref:YgzB family protein n=1 Tax=Salinicoccus sp. RF5 TaxID=2748874 RepID=UPI001E4C00FA|nr:YgzB family protein [Salinicoccus sp. RF5]MCC4723502.1 YgzB family protein [Salinicoccus sp. RF5]
MKKPGNKILRIRGYALALIFIGMGIMYLGVFFREYQWLFSIFLLIGLLPILLSFVIYFWVGLISTRAVTVQCPNCEKHTKILGHVDFCQHCKEPLTIDKELEGEEFSLDYNVEHRRKKAIDEKNAENEK